MKLTFKILIIFSVFIYIHRFLSITYATVNPLSLPNNKFGVHILFTSEINDAARLINSNGGDWGYVTIPIQAGDRDLVKWQRFMDDAKFLHVIPIIRLATENYYFNSTVWRKPEPADVLDFANFLNSLEWPTTNRYVIVFNETNRADEWGGVVSASEYAQILDYAVEVFKSKSQDFFIISAGLDNAAENNGEEFRNEYTFMQEMYSAVPDVFSRIDGIASHSYPNPGFRQPPSVLTRRSIASFTFEKRLADLLGDKDFPVFITETGWSKDEISHSQIASYYKEAFKSVWSSENVVAVTPFLLQGGNGGFSQFSLTKDNGDEHEDYKAIKEIPKIKGEPLIKEGKDKNLISENTVLQTKDFSNYDELNNDSIIKSKTNSAAEFVKWLLKI